MISDRLAGEYSDPVRIVPFNNTEDWSRNVTFDITGEVRRPLSGPRPLT